MTRSTILAAAQTAATATDVVVVVGNVVTVALFSSVPIIAEKIVFDVNLVGQSGLQKIGELRGRDTAKSITSPGTYRIVRPDISAYGQDVGVQLES